MYSYIFEQKNGSGSLCFCADDDEHAYKQLAEAVKNQNEWNLQTKEWLAD